MAVEVRGSGAGVSRRWFVRALGLLGLVAALPRMAWAFFVRNLPVRTVEARTPDFDPASGEVIWPDGRRQAYALRVDGLVSRPLSLTYAQLMALPQAEQVSDFHCVEGWSVADLRWGGLRPAQIVALAQPLPTARYVVFHALGRPPQQPQGQDHYVECFPLDALLDPQRRVMLALRLNGAAIPADHGAPLRVISPFDLAYKSIKFVERMEFCENMRPGWWTLANPIYPADAPVPAERLRRSGGE